MNKSFMNGKNAEDCFKKLYPDVTFINNIIDFYMDDCYYVEIKSCQKNISSGNTKYPYRKGRFHMEKEQHKKLIDVDGLYCFFVFDSERLIVYIRFIPAKILKFQQKISWNKIIGR